jgi:hypothetical protein
VVSTATQANQDMGTSFSGSTFGHISLSGTEQLCSLSNCIGFGANINFHFATVCLVSRMGVLWKREKANIASSSGSDLVRRRRGSIGYLQWKEQAVTTTSGRYCCTHAHPSLIPERTPYPTNQPTISAADIPSRCMLSADKSCYRADTDDIILSFQECDVMENAWIGFSP